LKASPILTFFGEGKRYRPGLYNLVFLKAEEINGTGRPKKDGSRRKRKAIQPWYRP